MNRLLVIRADASAAIGSGHVMRCLALAQAWQASGGTVRFASAELPPALEQRVRAGNHECSGIAAPRGTADDAAATIALAQVHAATWIVADGYCFDAAWQRLIKDAGLRLAIVDDYGQARRYHADLILNQNLEASASLYADREPGARLLLGCQYALLRRDFVGCPPPQRRFDAPATRVLVTLGGGDPENITAKVVAALGRLTGIEATIVVGGSNPHLAAIRTSVAAAGHRLVVDAADMPALMAWADVAITAAGSTSWELARMGLCAIQLVIADNQASIAAALASAGATVNLGDARVVDEKTIADRLTELLADSVRRQHMSVCAAQLVDGHGAARVAAALGAPLRLTMLSDESSWLNAWLPQLQAGFEADGHKVRWIHDPVQLEAGDIAFFLSLSRVVPAGLRRLHAHNLVVHESALPKGRGWSPLTWQVLEGRNEIPVTLLEAAEAVDAGAIHAATVIHLRGDELVDELRAAQAAATLRLCRDFVAGYPSNLAAARPQAGEPSYYPRRRPVDSRLDPDKTLREQFNLLRACDPDRYPAYFEVAGRRYEVRVTASVRDSQ